MREPRSTTRRMTRWAVGVAVVSALFVGAVGPAQADTGWDPVGVQSPAAGMAPLADTGWDPVG
ncbi:MAG TPA: hypothetical protein VFJ19_02580 [Nocardioidaceae bacterium]|nr:hypothetical protein [Nocardioidaceae bacterium]